MRWAAHARDELGISEITTARPVQAALASAATFALGAVIPLLTVLVASTTALIPVVVATSIALLAVLGGVGAHAGGASIFRAPCGSPFGARWRWRSPPESVRCSALSSEILK